MKRPSFQFYPGDWQANSNLRRCTHAEKGAWLDVMCLMHDQPEYGQLRWPLKEIAQAIGATPALLRGLVTKGVLKGDDKAVSEAFVYTPRSGRRDGDAVTLVPTQAGPLWYSSRMVKDEYVRTIRGESTRFGEGSGDAPKHPPKAAPKPPLGDGSSSSSSSPPSGNTEAIASAGKPAESLTKAELWSAGKSLLRSGGMPEAQCGAFVGKLCKDYEDAIVIDAVREAVVHQPADAASYLKSACQRLSGQRKPAAKLSKHTGFQTMNYREGVTADGSLI
jgi:hypothetical protein